MTMLGSVFTCFVKLLPALFIFILFSSFEGNLRWLGLLGFIPLVLAFQKGCTACMTPTGKEPDDAAISPRPFSEP